VLADAAGEDQGVEAAEAGDHAAYYREETLRSDLARESFVLPDPLAGATTAKPGNCM
jgi:hypothetical protein